MTVTAFLKKSNLTCQTEGMNIITMDLCTFSVAALDEQRDHIQFGRTEYKIHLLSYIRLRWTTSEFTGRLQNLLDDFRIYWTTSKILDDFKNTGRLQNLLDDFRIYWTTSDFYWTTWVLEVKISSATWHLGPINTRPQGIQCRRSFSLRYCSKRFTLSWSVWRFDQIYFLKSR